MVDDREVFLTGVRQSQLVLNPVQGEFDVAHLREVHRRIFQDLPHHGPGEFRPDASGHFKNRSLEATNERVVVPYALRRETDQQLGPALAGLQGGKALAGLDTLEMSKALAQTYSQLDYLHPFREGNSRTLRTFTEHLAQENGHRLDWGTTNVTARSRDELYVARDVAVIQLRYPGLTAEKMMTVESREEYEMAFQLNKFRLHDPLQEIVRVSLERGRDQEPSDRRITVADAAREIRTLAPIAANRAERDAEETRLAVLRKKADPSEHEKAVEKRDWVAREGNMAALSERLSRVESGSITIRYNPGAPALERLSALADGIGRELAQQRSVAAPSASTREKLDGSRDTVCDDRDRPSATDFRRMSQAERLNDKHMNPGAKQIAAMEAAIDHKYGKATPEAARMKVAAREAVAQTLERGSEIRAPRVRETELRRDEARVQERPTTDKAPKDRDRDR